VSPAKWNTLKFALWGAVFGGALQLVKIVLGQADSYEPVPLATSLVGGIADGAIALALVAYMRNLMTQAR
jgi:hypothetical protein